MDDVIIFGSNHNNTLGLVRSLGESGHKITVLLYDGCYNYVAKSKYVKKSYIIKLSTDVITLIISIAKKKAIKPFLLCAGDNEASIIDENYELLNKYVITEGCGLNGGANKYRNKSVSSTLAKQIGFNIPKTILLEDLNGIDEIKSFPVIVKANNSIHGGKSVIQICNDRKQLITHVCAVPQCDYPIQVQEYVKKEYEIMLLGCSMDGGKKNVCKIANRRVRVFPDVYGAAAYSYSVFIDNDEGLCKLRELINIYISTIGYTGLYSAEFLYYRRNYYFLEINLRNDGTSYLSTKCGFNLPHIFCMPHKKEQYKDFRYSECFYINTVADFHHVLNGKVSFLKWIKQALTAGCYSHFNKKDVIPYIYYIFSILFR